MNSTEHTSSQTFAALLPPDRVEVVEDFVDEAVVLVVAAAAVCLLALPLGRRRVLRVGEFDDSFACDLVVAMVILHVAHVRVYM
jgi:hypothetical protein